jgi:hypothetical protein
LADLAVWAFNSLVPKEGETQESVDDNGTLMEYYDLSKYCNAKYDYSPEDKDYRYLRLTADPRDDPTEHLQVVDLLLRLPESQAWKERSPLKKVMQIFIELTRASSETAHYYLRAFDKALYPQLTGFGVGDVPEKMVDYVRRYLNKLSMHMIQPNPWATGPNWALQRRRTSLYDFLKAELDSVLDCDSDTFACRKHAKTVTGFVARVTRDLYQMSEPPLDNSSELYRWFDFMKALSPGPFLFAPYKDRCPSVPQRAPGLTHSWLWLSHRHSSLTRSGSALRWPSSGGILARPMAMA